MAWVDFSKVYDMVPHAWIIKALKLIVAALNVIALLKSTMIDWKTELISGDMERESSSQSVLQRKRKHW